MTDGIINQAGLAWAGASTAYLAALPLTSWLASQGGIVQKTVTSLVSIFPGPQSLTRERIIPALGVHYVFTTFILSAALSVAGQAMSRKDGLDNNNPRRHLGRLEGIPLRLHSAHNNLLEVFPSFAFVAALAHATGSSQEVVNLLALHVLLKTVVYYPTYILDLAPLRSFAHIVAISAVFNALYRIAT